MKKIRDVEVALGEMKLKLGGRLCVTRIGRRMSQSQLAELIHTSQSRVAMMERADSSVSLDLLVRAHLALGASGEEIARIIAEPLPKRRL